MTLSLNKSIPAVRLHPRTGAPTTDPEALIPFGAILEYAGRDRDFDKFKYMGDMYRTTHDVFVSATNYALVKEAEKLEAAKESAPEPTATAAAPAPEPGPRLTFESLPSNLPGLKRAAVPGGWLIVSGVGIAFLPDPEHLWDGASIPRP